MRLGLILYVFFFQNVVNSLNEETNGELVNGKFLVCDASDIISESYLELYEEIKSLDFKDDYFNIINNEIYYSNEGNVYKTRCTEINKIYLPVKTNRCTRDLFINYLIKNVIKVGFLQYNGIIRSKTIDATCNSEIEKFFSFDKKIELPRLGKMSKFIKDIKNHLINKGTFIY